MLASLLGVFDRSEQEPDARLELGRRSLEGRQRLVVGAGLMCGVADAPVDRLRRTGELGTDLTHAVAEADHVVEAPAAELVEVLGAAAGQIDAALAHHADGVRMQRLGMAPGADGA